MKNIFSEDYNSNDCKDMVIYDVLNFIRTCGKSEVDEIWYSDIKCDETTDLLSLFDNDQIIGLTNDIVYVGLVYLENNKVLSIRFKLPERGDRQVLYYFTLRCLGDCYSLDVKDNFNAILECSVEGRRPIEYDSCRFLHNDNLPIGKKLLKDIIRPVSLDQLYERGMLNNKKTGKR